MIAPRARAALLAVAAAVAAPGCGRVGFDAARQDAGADAPTDGATPGRALEVDAAWRWGGAGDDHLAAAARVPSGDLAVAAEIATPVDFGGGAVAEPSGGATSALALATFALDGTHVWSRGYKVAAYDHHTLLSDASGLYLAGCFSGAIDLAGAVDPFDSGGVYVAAFSHAGAPRWAYAPDGAFLLMRGMTISGGRVTITGEGDGSGWQFGGAPLSGGSGTYDAFVASYRTSDGGHAWSRRLFGAFSLAFARAVTTGADGRSYALGTFADDFDVGGAVLSPGTDRDLYLASYDASGALVRGELLGSDGDDTALALEPGPSGDLLVALQVGAPLDLGLAAPVGEAGSIVLAAAPASGGPARWALAMRGPAPGDLDGLQLAPAGARTWVALAFRDTLTIGATTLQSAGGLDIALLLLEADGAVRAARQLGGAGDDVPLDLVALDADRVAVAGAFTGTLPAGATALVSAGGLDAFLALVRDVPAP